MATKTKVGEFGSISILSRSDSPCLLLYYRDPVTNKQKYKSTGQETLKEAMKVAKAFHVELAKQIGIDPDDFTPVPVDEALTTAIKRSHSRDNRHRLNMGKAAQYFLDFMADHYPKIKYWHQVDASHAEAWVDDLMKHKEGTKTPRTGWKTRKNYCSVLTLTARYWHNIKPAKYHAFRVHHHGLVPDEPIAKNYALLPTVDFLVELAGRLDERYAKIAFALGGYCGLNSLEIIARLREDFDTDEKTISISRSKNAYRTRTIPVAPFVMDLVQEHWDAFPNQTFLMEKESGEMAEDFTLYKCMRRVLDDALLLASSEKEDQVRLRRKRLIKGLGDDAESIIKRAREHAREIGSIVPKDMRKSFMNIADENDVNDRWLQAYVGHAPRSVMDRNYRSHEKLEKMRKHVVDIVYGDRVAGLAL